MLTFNGQDVSESVVVEIEESERNPYDAVKSVFIGSAYPLKDVDRIMFVAENIKKLEPLCAHCHEEFLASNRSLVKAPTHNGTSTLH